MAAVVAGECSSKGAKKQRLERAGKERGPGQDPGDDQMGRAGPLSFCIAGCRPPRTAWPAGRWRPVSEGLLLQESATSPSGPRIAESMRPTSTRVLLLGGALFLVGTGLLLLWMEGQSRLFLSLGLGFLCVSVLSLLVAGRWMQGRPDPLEARRERRLWRSGPLGRWWLERRKRKP